jgi:hypothetical protein
MTIPQEFTDWLLANSPDAALVLEAVALLDLIPKTWVEHRRCMPPAPAELGNELLRALVENTGYEIKRIEFRPFGLRRNAEPDPEDEERLNLLFEQVEDNTTSCVGGYLDEEPFLDDSLGETVDGTLSEFVDCVFGGHLDLVCDLVYYYLGFVLLGDRERTDIMLSLIKLLPLVIPIGEFADEPGAWLVLVGGTSP